MLLCTSEVVRLFQRVCTVGVFGVRTSAKGRAQCVDFGPNREDESVIFRRFVLRCFEAIAQRPKTVQVGT